MPLQPPMRDLPIVGYFDVQRFPQFCPADAANWYLLPNTEGKKKVAMYPALGRRHVNFLNQNRLIFNAEPRAIFKSVNYWFVIVNDSIFRIDKFFNILQIDQDKVISNVGNIFFTYLTIGAITFDIFTDGLLMYVYREDTNSFDVITDTNAPPNPLYIATFGNRIVCSSANTSTFFLSAINLEGNAFNPATAFTSAGAAVFAQEDGIIGQMGVLHNTLYIFTPFTTGIWQNTPAIFSGSGVTFPFKKNTTFSFDFGIGDPLSLDIDFDMMIWEARNRGGLVQFMYSSGQAPQNITSKAVDILLQTNANLNAVDPFLVTQTEGFIYSYENTIFYRVSLGRFMNFGQLDLQENAFSIEYNFESEQWSRVIEANGERNLVQKSLYFNNRHFVTIEGEGTIYEMSGQFYTNEIRNTLQTNPQAVDAYIQEPFRYERITPIIHEDDYAEFLTEYVEIDFVWGDGTFIYSTGAFSNAIFIVDEDSTPTVPDFLITEGNPDNDPTYIISETGNFPQLNEPTYNSLFKPNITLYWSDNGGVTFSSADNLEFSQLGVYQWRMRWYQLGCSRNRVYKLVCVSPSPIVVLGGVMNVRRVSEYGR